MEQLLFFSVLACWIMQITSSEVSSDLLRVQMGESITLNCTMTNINEIAWYHQNNENLTLLISAETDTTGRKLLITYNRNRSRLNLNANSWMTIVSLIISGITESDLGLYFCGTKSDSPNLLFDKAIKVQTQDNIRELSKEDLITDDLTVKERVLMFGGVGLAILMFFLATITVGGIIHRHGWQKGWTVGKDATALNSD